MKDVRDAKAVSLAAHADELHHLRQLGAWHHTVLRDEVRAEPADRSKGAFAAFPQAGAFLFAPGKSHFTRPVFPTKFDHALRLPLQTRRKSIQLDNQHRARVEGKAEMISRL